MEDRLEGGTAAPAGPANGRENNFTAIRIIATLFVFAGHLGNILGAELLTLGGWYLQDLGVMLLFLESGYLVSKSWEADPHPLRYLIRRFLRLWPPFAVMILLMVYVAGPLVSELGVSGYFQSWYRAYLSNLKFFIVFAQPGVFADMPVAYATNGSLWTMPIEAVMYLLTPLLLFLFSYNRADGAVPSPRRAGGVPHSGESSLRIHAHQKRQIPFPAAAALVILLCIFDSYLRTAYDGYTIVVYATDWLKSFHLAVAYLIGMLYTRRELQKFLNLQAAFAALLLWMVFQPAQGMLKYILCYLALPYAVFSFALAPKPLFCRLGRRIELSYGIYLYGFFFEQLLAWIQIRNGGSPQYLPTFFLSLLPTLGAALLSFYLVERPMKRLTRFLTGKIRKRRTAEC